MAEPAVGRTLLTRAILRHTVDNIPALHVLTFIGREDVLREIERRLSDLSAEPARPKSVVLVGMGGQGKTQIALRYCSATKESELYDAVLWADATSATTLRQSYVGIARTLGISILLKGSLRSEPEVVKDALSKIRYLLVLDSCDNPKAFLNIKEYIPSAPLGLVVITSRHRDISRLGEVIPVVDMNEQDATELLSVRLERKDETHHDSVAVVNAVGCLLLAVDHAA